MTRAANGADLAGGVAQQDTPLSSGELTMLIGKVLLGFCAAVTMLGSLAAEFSSNHVFNQKWDAHARFHCATYGMTNAMIGVVCLVLLFTSAPVGLLTAIALMLSVDVIMLLGYFVPGVSVVAEGERVVRGFPISYWMTGVHLLILLIGGALLLSALSS